MHDPWFLSKTLKNQISPEDKKIHRPTVDTFNVLEGMAKLAERQLDPIGQAISEAEGASCIVYSTSTDPAAPSQWTGSGFLLPHGLVITANHVVAPPEIEAPIVAQVSFDGETVYPAQVLGGDASVDVAVLQVDPSIPVRPVMLSEEMPVPGEIVAAIGAPEGWANIVTVGRVSATDMTPPTPPDPSWKDLMFIDADILEGSSGSMVIDIRGKVVGCVMGIIGRHAADRGTGQNAVVSIQKILKVIEEILRKNPNQV